MCGLLSFPAAAAAKSLQSCPTLCDPIDGSPSGSPVSGILQARTLEWVAISFSKHESEVKVKVKSCPTLSDPMDCRLPGSSVHGIFQARVLEWGAIDFSKLWAYAILFGEMINCRQLSVTKEDMVALKLETESLLCIVF